MPTETKVECLACGQIREIAPDRRGFDECPRCGYSGWAPAGSLTEDDRQRLKARLKPPG
jgi:hypothetical protein